jgi:hypothetical protein
VSGKFVWQNILISHVTKNILCRVWSPVRGLDVSSAFEKFDDIAFVQLIVDETNRYAQQEI